MICRARMSSAMMWLGRFVFLLHHENRVSHRTEARVRGRISDDRFLIHLRDERKKHLLFLLDMRIHFAAKFFDQFGNLDQFGISIAPLCRDLRCHLSRASEVPDERSGDERGRCVGSGDRAIDREDPNATPPCS